ncbi:hypothetical protein BG011_006939 [Mortierella polycephala]|uniref:Beta-flanking protein n=1 Tax=Mortierella polycephala TaxID=41804 RepID=A0A9P6PT85_9FUNG|nr:hypothetical protein BG011_006939 [Mortierella polycephala]
MDFLKNAASNYQQYSSAAATNNEGNSSNNVAQSDVPPPQESDIHEAKAVHDKVYNQNASDVTDEDLGKAAGVEAFNSYERSEASGQGEGGGQSKLVQMAMAEAMKMFSGGKGGEGGQDKSAVIQSAIAMATKLFMGKSGEGGGGVSQLMSMLQGGGKTDGSQGGSGGMMGMLGQAAENPQVAGMLKKFM